MGISLLVECWGSRVVLTYAVLTACLPSPEASKCNAYQCCMFFTHYTGQEEDTQHA